MLKHNVDFKKSFVNQPPLMIDNTIAEVILLYSKLTFVNRFKSGFLSSATIKASTIAAALSSILSRPDVAMKSKK